MDVERIQKINNLALDLMKQGLAEDREDAIARAEKIFRHRDAEDYGSIRERMEEQKKEEKNLHPEELDLSQEKIKEILEQNTKFLVKTIKEFQEKIASLEREIASLKSRLISQAAVKEFVSSPKEKGFFKPETSAPERKEKPKEGHPRSGNYNDEDVSIEKFFYMGSK